MEVTSDGPEQTVESQVLDELMTIRKSKEGFTLGALAASPVISQLLGAGDPLLAYNTFKERLFAHLRVEESMPIEAALASLRLTADRDTHLDRLVEFGQQRGYDQRQVRRYSDRGVRELARLISGHWVTVSSPDLIVLVSRTGPETAECAIQAREPEHVEMRHVNVTVLSDEHEGESIDFDEVFTELPGWLITDHLPRVVLDLTAHACTVVIVWQGELWPKFTVRWIGDFSTHAIGCETLGNKLHISFEAVGTQ
jgi:hypothetical protein